MNQYTIISLICIGSIIPACFILKAIFGKSVMLTVGIWTVAFVLFCSGLHFIAGTIGISALFWVTPLAFAVGTLIYMYLNKILKLPLNQLIIKVKQVSEGDFAIEKNESILKNELDKPNRIVTFLKTTK